MPNVTTTPRAVDINGRKQLLIAGCIHYWRSTPDLWPELIQRSREYGINTIQTYVNWGVHERNRGEYDFSGRYDLPAFCRAVQDAGLHLIVRMGPYICGEVNYGGFPFWLREIPGIQFRTRNKPFMREMGKWIRALGERIRPFSIANGGPLILAEIENEYAALEPIYGDEGRRYMQWAIDLGHSLELDVPWLTCLPVENALPTIHGFQGWPDLEQFRSEHPEVPPLWTENWPGWFNTFGHVKRLRSPEDVAYETCRFFAEGGAGVSYFMWHAGTNFGREGMFLQCPNYGFGAPLDEYGRPTTKARHLKQLHEALISHHDVLINDMPDREPLGTQLSACSYGGGELAFLSNDAEEAQPVTWKDTEISLNSRSCVLFSQRDGIVYDTSELKPGDQVSRKYVPTQVSVTDWKKQTETIPTTSEQADATLARPEEQLQWTRDRTDYCWYVTDMTVEHPGPGILSLSRVADLASIFVDGHLVAATDGALPEDRGNPDTVAFSQQVSVSLPEGEHQLAILCAGAGLIKHDCMLKMENMAEERKGLWGSVFWKGEAIDGPWKIFAGLEGEQEAWPQSPNGWEKDDGESTVPCWWRTEFELPDGDGPFALDMGGMSRGLIWLNGRCLSRYWQIPAVEHLGQRFVMDGTEPGPSGDPVQRYYRVPASWLTDRNTLVVLDEKGVSPDDAAVEVMRFTYGNN